MKERIFSNYLLMAIVYAVAMLLVVAGFNFLVDPYGLFRMVEIQGVNQQKEGVRHKIRFVKSLELPLRKPKTILIGSSRVHDAFDPSHPLLQEYAPVYNLGVDMLRIKEGRYFVEHALANSDVKYVFFGLDFFMFNAAEKINPSLDVGLTGRRISFLDYLYLPLLTTKAVEDSLQTIRVSNAEEARLEFLPNGFRPGSHVFGKISDYAALHDYTNEIFLSRNEIGTPYYGRYVFDEEAYEDFESVIKACVNKKIQCVFFITPAHANLDGEGVAAVGLWSAMEDWKRRLTNICARYQVKLYDFSGYNEVTTESIRNDMSCYWDSSHFTTSVAGLILQRLIQPESNDSLRMDGFGVELKTDSIESHLQHIRRARIQYLSDKKENIELFRKTIDRVRNVAR